MGDCYDNRRGASFVLADNKQDDRVRCASPIFMLIAYYLGFTNRKYVEEKMTATLKKDIDRHGLKASSNSSQPPNPPQFFVTHYL
jgi:hypothetical protein